MKYLLAISYIGEIYYCPLEQLISVLICSLLNLFGAITYSFCGSKTLTSQLPASKWYEIISEKTIAYATLDRLVQNAHHLEITGESMRKKRISQDK